METRTPHYLRVAQALALATTLALPACAESDPPATGGDGAADSGDQNHDARGPKPKGATGVTTAVTTASVASAASTSGAGGAPGDVVAVGAGGAGGAEDAPSAGGARLSGPLPPPEMPTSLA